MKAVTLLSGGLDSVTLAYHLKAQGYELICLSFDYGQRHKKELQVAQDIAKGLGAGHHVIQIRTYDLLYGTSEPLGSILGDSVLVDQSKEVPDGHYADENMKQTVVPNRNAIMLSIAYGVAMANQADYVAFAAHSGDHAIYPDCRPEFVALLGTAFEVGAQWNSGDYVPVLIGPFLDHDKAWIAREAVRLGVPIEETWSCYKGGDIHCGTCGTCYERREAFKLAGVLDPTEYLDSTTTFAAPEGV
jgi:7-cyano-7-deazaguanine synthase